MKISIKPIVMMLCLCASIDASAIVFKKANRVNYRTKDDKVACVKAYDYQKEPYGLVIIEEKLDTALKVWDKEVRKNVDKPFSYLVKIIDTEAFARCSGLTGVITPNCLGEIGFGAFSECTNLKTVVLGKSMYYIGDRVFSNCTNIKDIFCYAEEPPRTSEGGNPFPFNKENVIVYVPENSIEKYKKDAIWGQFKKTIKKDDETIIVYNIKKIEESYDDLKVRLSK